MNISVCLTSSHVGTYICMCVCVFYLPCHKHWALCAAAQVQDPDPPWWGRFRWGPQLLSVTARCSSAMWTLSGYIASCWPRGSGHTAPWRTPWHSEQKTPAGKDRKLSITFKKAYIKINIKYFIEINTVNTCKYSTVYMVSFSESVRYHHIVSLFLLN